LKSLTSVVQKIPQHAHLFFWSAVRLDSCHRPTQYPISQCHNGIIQVLWLGIIIMFQLRHHRETACHSQPSLSWQAGKQVWVAALISQQPTQSNKTYVRYLFFKIHIIKKKLCQTSRVDLCVLFFLYPPIAVGNHQRGCLLKQDMSAGYNANCCSGRLSIGNLQGHTPWVFFWVPSRASSRLSAWFKRNTSVIVIKYWRAAPVGVHVCFKRHTCFDPSSRWLFAALPNHLAWPPEPDSDPFVLLLVCLQPAPQRPLYIYPVPPRTILRSAVVFSPHIHLTWLATSLWPRSFHLQNRWHQKEAEAPTDSPLSTWNHAHPADIHFHYFFLMFSCRLFVQLVRWSFAKHGHPGLFLQFQIRHYQIIPRFGSFESVHKKAEKYHQFEKMHSH